MTYKILYNDAVAMTGGQPLDGTVSVDRIARQVEAEGVRKVVVVSDDIEKYRGLRHRFPSGTSFHLRDELDQVQRRLRELPGVTVLIYDQACAAEKRRRRKKGALADPPRRVFINERVCDGCGDCSVQSNCLAVLPLDTALGRKRKIDQSSCNKDYACVQGFCPSFVSVIGGSVKKRSGSLRAGHARFDERLRSLPHPAPHAWTGPWDILLAGVGGTGVVTVGMVVATAAHLEGKSASVLDFMGFAQKGGAVLSHVRLADTPARLNQVRIDTQQADVLLACDLVVGASADALLTVRHGRTRILANLHEVPVAASVGKPDAALPVLALLEKLRHAAGMAQVRTVDAQALAEDFMGDAIVSNILQLGFAWQSGLVPVALESLLRAIELNGVAIDNNKLAFSLGRMAAADPQALASLLHGDHNRHSGEPADIDSLLAQGRQILTAWRDEACASDYAQFVATVRKTESGLKADPALPFTCAVARSLLKLTAIKDEYEVARLYTDGGFQRALDQQFEGDYRLEFHMAPPLLSRESGGKPPRKLRLGGYMLPVMRLLASARGLRGTVFDVFGYGSERRLERALVLDYRRLVEALLPQLSATRLETAVAIALLPLSMRGYGHVKRANVALARARQAELLHRFNPGLYARPALTVAGQLRGIPVVSA